MTFKSSTNRHHRRDPFDPGIDEFLEYYRQHRHPDARPEGYDDSPGHAMNQPIRYYHHPDSHYRQTHPSGTPTGIEEIDPDDRMTADVLSDVHGCRGRRTSFRKPRKWCSLVLSSLRRRKEKTRPCLSRIPCQSTDNFIGGDVYDFGPCFSTLPAASLSDADSQSRDSGHSSGTGSLPTYDFNKEVANFHDNHSTYSYNTARDDGDSGLGSCCTLNQKLREWKFEDPDSKVQEVKKEEKMGICKRSMMWGLTLFKTLMTVVSLGVILTALVVSVRYYSCSYNLELSRNVGVERFLGVLEGQLFGQAAAVGKIFRLLEKFYSEGGAGVMVVILAGASGVGKTHTLSLMKSVFPVPSNVHSFSGVSKVFQDNEDILDELAGQILRDCGVKLVTFDDYNDGVREKRADQGEKMARFIQKISKAENKTLVMIATTLAGDEIANITVEEAKATNAIPQFSEPEDKSYLKMSQDVGGRLASLGNLRAFSPDISVEVVPFLPLGRESVRKCVGWTLSNDHNLHLSTFEMRRAADMILEQLQFFSAEFPIFSVSGCKQVSSKVNLLFDPSTGRPDGLKEL